jgi:hypothetical protein
MANIERLKQLRRVIEEAPEDRLHMRAYSEVAECGTAYCAAGWAAVDSWFQKNTEINETLEVTEEGRIIVADIVADGDRDEFENFADIFGIHPDDSEALFGADPARDIGPHAVSKAQVLDNIDRLLKGKPAEVYPGFCGRLYEDIYD